MADDAMNNGSNGFLDDVGTRVGILSQRVVNVETQLASIGSAVATISAKVDERFTALNQTIAERNRTPWGTLIAGAMFFLAVASTVGYLAFSSRDAIINRMAMDIRDGSAENQTTLAGLSNIIRNLVETLPENFIPRKETERLSARAAEDRARVEELLRTMIPRGEVELLRQSSAADRQHLWDDLSKLRDSAVTRAEWDQQIHGRDLQIADLNRRVDEVREALGNQYTTRDLLLSTQQELNELRNKFELFRGLAPPPIR